MSLVARKLCSTISSVFLYLQNGDTPLHIAAAMGRRKLVRILLESGLGSGGERNDGQPVKPILETLNLQHERALDIAQRKEHKEIVEMLQNPPLLSSEKINTSITISEENKKHVQLMDLKDSVVGKSKKKKEKTLDKSVKNKDEKDGRKAICKQGTGTGVKNSKKVKES